MPKEHWTVRWRRRMKALEDENTQLKKDMSTLRKGGKTSQEQALLELRAVVQSEVREVSVTDLMNFAYSTPEVNRAQHPYGGQAFQPADSHYYCVSKPTFERILQVTQVDTIEWMADKTDCEDIAKYFSALVSVKLGLNSVGVVRSADGGHAFGFAIVNDGELDIIYFEPQTDEILGPDHIGKGMYKMGPGKASFTL